MALSRPIERVASFDIAIDLQSLAEAAVIPDLSTYLGRNHLDTRAHRFGGPGLSVSLGIYIVPSRTGNSSLSVLTRKVQRTYI